MIWFEIGMDDDTSKTPDGVIRQLDDFMCIYPNGGLYENSPDVFRVRD